MPLKRALLNSLVSREANLVQWLEQLGLENSFTERCEAVKDYKVIVNGVLTTQFQKDSFFSGCKYTVILLKNDLPPEPPLPIAKAVDLGKEIKDISHVV